MFRNWALLAVAPLALSACATNGTQGAAVGAGLGAVAGAIIGNNTGDGDAETGALIGAIVGGAAGAYAGCQRPGGCGWNANNSDHSELYYDRYSGRYWYEDYRDGSTWWENGEARTAGRR